MKNNRGFVITEVLVLSTVIIGVLIFMYAQFKSINRSYQYSFKYDTVEGLYLANNIVNYINDGAYDTLVINLNNSNLGYLDITDCSVDYFSTTLYCNKLFERSEVEQVLFVKEDLNDLKQNMGDFSEDLIDYINSIKISNAFNDYRIIIKYHDETFASMRFNKGNIYTTNGLIVLLDGINNTGNGHSNITSEWKDLSGHDYNATLYNNPTWGNNSITFDGTTNYGLINKTANMEFLNGMTREIRVKLLSLIGGTDDGYSEIFGNWQGAGGGFSLYNYAYFRATSHFNGSSSVLRDSTERDLSQFYTLTTTYDNNNFKFYVNGVLIQEKTSESSNVLTVSSVPFGISVNPGLDGIDSYANAEFESVRIYDRALSDEEIQNNYNVDISRFGGE